MERKMSRRELIGAGVAASSLTIVGDSSASTAGPLSIPPFELEEVSIAELQDGMRSGKWTAAKLVEAYRARIEALDRKGPALRAVLEDHFAPAPKRPVGPDRARR